MTNKELKKRIEDVLMKSVDISRNFNNRNFKAEIEGMNFNNVFYSATNENTNYYGLGVFNFLIELASNAHWPKTISTKKPNGNNYIKYLFIDEKLKLVRHIRGGEPGLAFYVGDDYVAQLTERKNFAVSCVWLINGKSQMFVETYVGSLGASIITDLGDGYFRLEEFDPFFYASTIYKLVDEKYHEEKMEKRAIMPFDEGVSFMSKYDPYFINSEGNSLFKARKSTWESFKESGWEIL